MYRPIVVSSGLHIFCDFTMLRCYNYVDLQKGQLGCTLETHHTNLALSSYHFPLLLNYRYPLV